MAEMYEAGNAGREAVDALRGYVTFRHGEGSHRREQEHMTAAVADALEDNANLICQAGTGTGKSIGYLNAIATIGTKTVIATATKALSEQLVGTDLPALDEFLISEGKRPLSFAMLKGRNNYACLLKIDQIEKLGEQEGSEAPVTEQMSLLGDDDEDALKKPTRVEPASTESLDPEIADYMALLEWVKTTESGDRAEGPATGEWAWEQISASASACLGASNCPFAAECFSEKARAEASAADIAVTNHALLAADMKVNSLIFGDFDAVVVDEVHDLQKTLSSAWGTDLDPESALRTIKQAAKTAASDDAVKKAAEAATGACSAVADALEECEPGTLPELPDGVQSSLRGLSTAVNGLAARLGVLADSTEGVKGGRIKSASQSLADLSETIRAPLATGTGSVRWLEVTQRGLAVVKTAPIDVGELLQKYLDGRLFIATSATCMVGGRFDSMIGVLGLNRTFFNEDGDLVQPRKYRTLDAGSPFAWDKSAMLYIPAEPFPEPVGRDRTAHTEAVLEELLALTSAAGGRTLFLSTTTAGAKNAAEFLRSELPPTVNVYAHGDGTAGQLADWFINDETSVLCATMGMWAGINAVGPSCSLVVIDKIPFPPMDDPLTNARSQLIDEQGGSGFMEVSVSHAGIMLAQGAGRLIRSHDDKGVVAILDRRLMTKRYGKALVASLPPIRTFTDLDQVTAALERLTGGLSAIETSKSSTGGSSRVIKPYPKPTGKPSKPAERSNSRSSSEKNSWGRGAKKPVTSTRRRKPTSEET